MAREFKVTSLEVVPSFDGKENVVKKIMFTYGDSETFIGGFCKLGSPGGEFIPLESITKEKALNWLLENLQNTTDEFDKQIEQIISEKNNTPFEYDWQSIEE